MLAAVMRYWYLNISNQIIKVKKLYVRVVFNIYLRLAIGALLYGSIRKFILSSSMFLWNWSPYWPNKVCLDCVWHYFRSFNWCVKRSEAPLREVTFLTSLLGYIYKLWSKTGVLLIFLSILFIFLFFCSFFPMIIYFICNMFYQFAWQYI